MDIAGLLGIAKISGCFGIVILIAVFIFFIYKKGKETGAKKKEEEIYEEMEARLIELTKELNSLTDNPNAPFRVRKPEGKWGEIRKTNP
ncbi:MAG TPA: hypothetical protein DDW17_02155 [Deltaproteobacteria bacterium]|nr:hypothetical protein [Deltaproteobacteria bacterium]